MKLTVLIASTETSLQTAYRAALVAAGFEALTVSSGLECLAALRRRHLCALVLDPDLIWGSGAGVLALMSEEGELPSVPVVILNRRPLMLDELILPREYAIFSQAVPPTVLVGVVQALIQQRHHLHPVFI